MLSGNSDRVIELMDRHVFRYYTLTYFYYLLFENKEFLDTIYLKIMNTIFIFCLKFIAN